MVVAQTIEVPASRRVILDIPPQIPTGKVILTFTPAPDTDGLDYKGECPLCAKSHTPNAETAAAIREGRAMMRGEIPATWYDSLDDMWKDLVKEDSHD